MRITVTYLDTGLPCYFQGYGESDTDVLAIAAVDGGTTVGEVIDQAIDSIVAIDRDIPRDSIIRAAFLAALGPEVRLDDLWDESLEVSTGDEESVYSYFAVEVEWASTRSHRDGVARAAKARIGRGEMWYQRRADQDSSTVRG